MHPMLSLLISRENGIPLVISVETFLHSVAEHTIVVRGEQCVPTASPNHLEHLPICPSKSALQLLNDLSVATYRSIEPLQVAIDHHDEVIQSLPGSDVDCAQNFGLVGFTIANKAPNARVVWRQ